MDYMWILYKVQGSKTQLTQQFIIFQQKINITNIYKMCNVITKKSKSEVFVN